MQMAEQDEDLGVRDVQVIGATVKGNQNIQQQNQWAKSYQQNSTSHDQYQSAN